jgi:hypothetical protein
MGDILSGSNTSEQNVEIFDLERAVRVFRQKFALEDAIGSHACSLEALTCM